MLRRLIMFFISLVSLFFIVSLGRSILALWDKGSAISDLRHEREVKQRENAELKQKLAQVQTPEFIEKQAREKLNLQRAGEEVVVLPKNLSKPELSGPKTAEVLSPREQWWRLFF